MKYSSPWPWIVGGLLSLILWATLIEGYLFVWHRVSSEPCVQIAGSIDIAGNCR